jgi:hypothetical protein
VPYLEEKHCDKSNTLLVERHNVRKFAEKQREKSIGLPADKTLWAQINWKTTCR